MKMTGEAKLLAALGAVVLVGVGFMFATSARPPSGPGATPMAAPTPTALTAALVDELYAEARHTKGDKNAALTIVEFADLECPNCRRAYADTVKDIEKKLPTKFAFYHLPLEMHPRAVPAATALESAAKQGKFWEMYAELFDQKSEPLTDEVFEAAAKKIGLDVAKFKTDLAADDVLSAVYKDRDHATEHNINTTPTFLVKDKNGAVTSVAGAGAFAELFKDLQDGAITAKPAGAPPAGAPPAGAPPAP